jgi:tetratricopeptide (TPR) repeat protein
MANKLFTEAITVTEQVQAISCKTLAIKAKFPFVKASLQIYSGKSEKAELMCHSMLAMARVVGSINGLKQSLDDLGRIAALKGEYAKACDYFIECLVLRRKHYGPALVAMTLSYLGNVYLNLGTPNDLAAAQHCFDEARQYAEKMQDQFQLGFAKLNLGRLALRLNAPQIAAQHFQEVFEVYANYESRPHMEMARAHEGLSDVANILGDFAAQREHLAQALLMYAALRLPNLVGVMTQKLALLPD